MYQAIGAGLAGVAGGLGSYWTAQDQQRAQEEAMRNYDANMISSLNAYQNQTQKNIDRYDQNSQQYLNSPDKIAQWLNPNMDYQMQQIAKANNQQYAAGGKMLTGAAMKGLQDRSQNQAKLSFNDAFNMMNTSNNQGLNHLQFGTGMSNDLASNMFNAQQGMYGNQLNAAMGQRTAGVGDFLTGFGSGANAFGNVMNAFRSSPGTGQPGQVQTAGT
jgi:hypothetical protein